MSIASAPDADPRVPARYYARLGEILVQQGVDFTALLRAQKLSPSLLSDPEATLRFSQVDQLVQYVFASTGRADLGVEGGRLLTASAHSFVGFVMFNSDTLDQALRFEAQYFRLIMPSFRMRYSRSPDSGEMAFSPRTAMSPLCLHFHLEAIAMAAVREISDLTAEHRPPCILELSIPEPPHAPRYPRELLRNVDLRFGVGSTPGVRLRLLDDPRRLRLTMADPHARRIAEDRCRALVQQAADGGRFADWVAMTLREVAEGLPSLAELAAQLNISTRTLNRYLAREGTTYRALAGRIQHEIACERLASGAMSVTEVAYSLGFSDAANFTRAFRSRAGYSPGAHRRMAAAP